LDAKEFVIAMQATVHWSSQRSHKRKDTGATPPSGKTGQPAEHSFWLDYKCPCSGIYEAVPNSRKKHTFSQKCDRKSCFSIFHHIHSNTLRVDWEWRHNHNPFSVEQIQQNQTTQVVKKWLTEQVIQVSTGNQYINSFVALKFYK
jgi:hypothetical protein